MIDIIYYYCACMNNKKSVGGKGEVSFVKADDCHEVLPYYLFAAIGLSSSILLGVEPDRSVYVFVEAYDVQAGGLDLSIGKLCC